MSIENIEEIIKIVGKDCCLTEEPMSKHTTFHIGGNADYYVKPVTTEQVSELIQYCRKIKIPYYIIGNGSNLLVSDKGYRGVIIQILDNLSKIEIEEEDNRILVRAEAGVLLSRLGNELMKKSVAGFEFATGIPGTVGGAIMMNAGAYGGEIKDIVKSVTIMGEDGNVYRLHNQEMKFGYRNSVIMENNGVVLEAEFELTKGNQEQIRNRIVELAMRRKEKQPLEFPSAGSTFKRPEGYFAGKLITDAGLKGYRIKDAQVSEKHAGFVINVGNATASDVVSLTDYIKQCVKEKFGVQLQLEIRKLGFDK